SPLALSLGSLLGRRKEPGPVPPGEPVSHLVAMCLGEGDEVVPALVAVWALCVHLDRFYQASANWGTDGMHDLRRLSGWATNDQHRVLHPCRMEPVSSRYGA